MKNKEILKNYLYWFLTFIGCMLVGILKTYALTFTDFTDVHSNTTLYVGYSDSGNPISWPYNNSSLYQRNIISLDYVVNTQIVANTHYEFESHMLGEYLIGTSIYSVVDASGNTCLTDSYYLNFLNGAYPRWDFQCPNNSNGFTIHIQQSNSSRLFNDGYMGWGSAILSKTDTPISTNGNDTEEIINNANANTNQIIDNQNQNTDRIIESNKENFQTCRQSYNLFNKDTVINGYYVNSTNGTLTQGSSIYNASDFIPVSNGDYIWGSTTSTGYHLVVYDDNKNFIRAVGRTVTQAIKITIGNNEKYVRFTVTTSDLNTQQFEKGSIETQYEPYGEICVNKLDEQKNAINNLDDTLNDDNTDGAVSDASDFFSDFTTDTFGLTSIITAPLNLIQSLSSSTCSQLELPLPYLDNKKLILPCMTSIYSQYFGSFFTMYQTITYGIIAYWVIVRIFNLVKDFKNPEHDEIEVVDL